MLLNQLFIRVNCLYSLEINRHFNVLLLSLFPYIFMHTYNRRHNIHNQTSACAYAFNSAFIRVVL
jgi:hypothetical protein